jgi:hypothetical protein
MQLLDGCFLTIRVVVFEIFVHVFSVGFPLRCGDQCVKSLLL